MSAPPISRTMSLPTSNADLRPPLLRGVALACRRGDRLLFEGLDLEVVAGRLLWLRGANGSGKTSLLRVLAGLARPAGGELVFDMPERVGGGRGRPVYIGHANALKDDLTADESLRFLLHLDGVESSRAERVEALRRFGLASRRDALVRTLSQGQRRRVALSRLVLSTPATPWLLDEPFDALDADGVLQLEQVLTAHVHGGGAAVVTSHLPLGDALPAPLVVDLDRRTVRPAVPSRERVSLDEAVGA